MRGLRWRDFSWSLRRIAVSRSCGRPVFSGVVSRTWRSLAGSLDRRESAAFRHTFGTLLRVESWLGSEHMFAALEGTIDQQRERRREARRCELRSLFAQEARIQQRVTQIVREAEDDEDWQAAGCSSNAQWLAQIAGSDYRSAVRITRTSRALGRLPALDRALSTGALSLARVAAAAEFATPETEAPATSRPARSSSWQQSAADALVTLAPLRRQRWRREAQPHDPDRASQRRCAAATGGRRAAQRRDGR